RSRVEGAARLLRRRHDRGRRRQRRRRHGHVQLRRRREARDHDRRRRVRRHQLEPRGPPHDRRGRLHRRRLDHHEGRAAGRARGRAWRAGRQGRLDGTEGQEAQEPGGLAMCGIVGYVGDKNAVSIIVEGLKRLEYRGYDSAGVAVLHDGTLHVRRAAGRIKTLEGILRERPVTGSLGIGHTRWATHGRPSDENAHPHTDCRGVVILEDNEVAVVTAAGVELPTLDDEPVQRDAVRILRDPIMAEKGGYRHFMLKEIHEQPRAITDTFRGRIAPETGTVVLPDVNLDPATVKALERVVFVACGTAFHAATLGRTMVERLAGLGAEVDLASEFRYRDAIVGPETLVVAISQSGETADTLGAVKAARLKGCPILAITNVVGSALAREATGVLYMHAGPEIGVASTKAFSTMIVAA